MIQPGEPRARNKNKEKHNVLPVSLQNKHTQSCLLFQPLGLLVGSWTELNLQAGGVDDARTGFNSDD